MPIRTRTSDGVQRISRYLSGAAFCGTLLGPGLGLGLSLALGITSAAALAAPAAAPSRDAQVGELDALRQEGVAVARSAQQHERTLADTDHQIELLQRDVAARQRGLDDTRREQAQLLGILERLSRHPPQPTASVPLGPLDRARGELLLQAAVPALKIEAQALTAEFDHIARLRAAIEKDRQEAATHRDALARNHELLLQLATRRMQLAGTLAPDDAGGESRIRALGERASDLAALIKDADAEAAKHDKASDPTRPKTLRSFDAEQPLMLRPVVGKIADPAERQAAGGAGKDPAPGLFFTAAPGAEVVAPFDGRVIYSGIFRDNGLILIIRHSALYHSVLAGLGRSDVRLGEWMVAGEPVGVMPEAEAAKNQAGVLLNFELRREARAIDPEPAFAPASGDTPIEEQH